MNAGMNLCAGDELDPFEKTSDTVPVSLIGPVVTGGFEEL